MATTAVATCTETFVEVADVRLQLRRGGNGEPLLVLHSELGVPGWLQAYEQLAQHFTVYVPSPARVLASQHVQTGLSASVTWRPGSPGLSATCSCHSRCLSSAAPWGAGLPRRSPP